MAIDSEKIYFLSDSHFGRKSSEGETKRRDRFFRFLQGIPSRSTLFLLGDIFDFYFEYPRTIHNEYFDLFFALNELGRRVQIHFIGGNHDCWTGSFMRRELGLLVHDEEFFFQAQGRTVLCTHGDLILPGDHAYKLLKKVIRNHAVVGAAKLLHPDLLRFIAGVVSRGSRHITERAQEEMAARVAEAAFENFYKRGNDLFVMGHIHHPTYRTRDGKEFVILGDWLDNFSYAVLSGGRIRLERFTD